MADVDGRSGRRTTPADRPGLPGQLAIGLALFGLYVLVDASGGADRLDTARRHGRAVLDLEARLHLDIERTLNTWLAPHRVLSTLANYEYAFTYILSALALFAWIWARRPEEWRFARDSFVVLNLIAMATFLLYPTAPPRMLPGLGFVDTVSRGQTVGSWGSGPVDTANQLAAMPSLHIGWALWVSVVLARFTAGFRVQMVSAVHVLLTLFVVMATANHYLLDGFAVIVPIMAGVAYARSRQEASRGEVVASCDAFFLHVERTGAAQHVGGVVSLSPEAGAPTLEEVRRLATERLLPLPRFRKRVVATSPWRRMRWVETTVDIDRHVSEVEVDGPHGPSRAVARLAEEPLPRDRPLWRVVLVRGDVDGVPTATIVVLVHHAVADGIGTIVSCLRLFDPPSALPVPATRRPPALVRAGAVTVGLAQLAADGRATPLGPASPRRDFGLATVPFDGVRRAARLRGVRVTDLVLGLAVDAVRTAAPALAAGGSLRVSVPLMVQAPDAPAQGNATAAVIIDVPTVGDPEDLIAEVARLGRRLRRPTRAVASRFVMASGLRLLPEPCAAWFARTVYGGRYLHAVVSNLPGPAAELTMFGRTTTGVYPVLPVAPGTALAMGALTWTGQLGLGVATDPALLDAGAVTDALRDRLADVCDDGAHDRGSRTRPPLQREEQSKA